MKTRIAVLVSLLALVAVGCGTSEPAGAATKVRSDGRGRTYLVHRPRTVARDARPPLVVVLHGGFGSGRQAERDYGWNPVADRYGFVVAYPDGVANAWNAGTCCGLPMRSNVDDVAFVGRVVDALVRIERVDRTRVYVAGMSNGAMMAYRVACELPGGVTAIGPVAGSMVVPCANPPRPTSVMHIHGLADTNVRYEGGVGDGFGNDSRPSIPSVIERWRQIDRCPTPPTTTTQGPVTRSVSNGCADGTSVRLTTIEGAGHQWPGSRPNSLADGTVLDPPSTAMDATAELAAFFGLTSSPRS